MALYINRGNNGFRTTRNSEYVDKSGLIGVVNRTLDTEFKFTCVSRCRRFGKSMAAKMLSAYYDKSCDSRDLFADLAIAQDSTFETHLNKYRVIFIDMSDFTPRFKDEPNIVGYIEKMIKDDVLHCYPDVKTYAEDDLMNCLVRICEASGDKFVLIIDEWDAICREFKPGSEAMDRYVAWLRRMFKSVTAHDVFAGVYMTGILPIKKYKTESALNNFIEYSMVEPGEMASYFGFTKDEVSTLCNIHNMDFATMERWYDGYRIGDEPSMFNPNSVMTAIRKRRCSNFWGKTGAYDSVATYIQSNFHGLKDDILKMLAGGRVKVNTTKFQNDMSIIRSKDDALTVLIHLGYLCYNFNDNTCTIPNFEVWEEMRNAVEITDWTNVVDVIQNSENLLDAVIDGDEAAVARAVDAAHDDNTSILSYNNENSLACVLFIAFIAAKNYYEIHREFATGKGFADFVLIPYCHNDKPAMILELKFDKSADSAIRQIHEKRYTGRLQGYAGNLILVGINYDKDAKEHQCKIEKI
ncbi:MAG: ATP-binding protein [Bacteroidales bacterium]|nr:ATP-binding protein [Bacteroidales bacterium]